MYITVGKCRAPGKESEEEILEKKTAKAVYAL
jgi:hypothetical protein